MTDRAALEADRAIAIAPCSSVWPDRVTMPSRLVDDGLAFDLRPASISVVKRLLSLSVQSVRSRAQPAI